MATAPIAQGAPVTKFGQIIGFASGDIKPGDHVHTHNCGFAAFERDYVQAQQDAYLETCEEDDEIALRMDQGRAALLARGDDEVGPYQSPMEDGMQHFHEWYRRRLGGTLR
mgnify:CR=1 FL=1